MTAMIASGSCPVRVGTFVFSGESVAVAHDFYCTSVALMAEVPLTSLRTVSSRLSRLWEFPLPGSQAVLLAPLRLRVEIGVARVCDVVRCVC